MNKKDLDDLNDLEAIEDSPLKKPLEIKTGKNVMDLKLESSSICELGYE
eukprot:CAMPEP_0170568092 /NCGR_PEP_ID=MMETSP0211-20121228/80919_1 /TAXON_ID=311385 /ORGANISM="Pseudokeronopsis sp., Strain OXSARD2" /LENGTH=48 /DNA_ID= /DNA_START= /DNA_END= /DNA_ORIENTATION=